MTCTYNIFDNDPNGVDPQPWHEQSVEVAGTFDAAKEAAFGEAADNISPGSAVWVVIRDKDGAIPEEGSFHMWAPSRADIEALLSKSTELVRAPERSRGMSKYHNITADEIKTLRTSFERLEGLDSYHVWVCNSALTGSLHALDLCEEWVAGFPC